MPEPKVVVIVYSAFVKMPFHNTRVMARIELNEAF